MKSAALSIDALQAAVARLPDDKLSPTRRAALEHFRTRGMPTTRDEDWKYTDLARVIDISNQSLLDDSDHSAAIDLSATINEICESIDADWLVIANGVIDSESVAAISADQYRISLLSESEDRLDFEAPLADLNATLLRDGLRIDIDANAAPTRPIGILVVDDATTSPAMAQARVRIELKSDSTASFIEYHASTGKGEHYTNSLIDLILGDNSRARHVRIQDRDENHYQTNRTNVRVGADSEFNYCAFDLGGALIRNDIVVDISASGANAELSGLFLAGGRQHIDNHTRVDHRVGPATSEQNYRGILTGEARCVWNGKAIVHSGADGTDAQQSNHNLLLSSKAEIDTKPELEIYADDVKCSHGTTIGQLDEAALFYLRTRGLDYDEARQVLTRAFAQTIVDKAPIESMRDVLTNRIATRLGELMRETRK